MPRILDVILGRTRPAQANLDALFGLAGAQVTLQVTESLVPSGAAGVCYKPVSGRSFAETASETNELLSLDTSAAGNPLGDGAPRGSGSAATTPSVAGPGSNLAPKTIVHQEDDKYGYHWVVLHLDDFQELVSETHLVNATLQEHGYGPQLLCSVFAFRPEPSAAASGAGAPLRLAYLVYLFKRGTFYPFVPGSAGDEHRDLESELRLQNVLREDVKIEPDKERWMPLWGLPVS